MGYHFVRARWKSNATTDFLVLGSTYAVPLRPEGELTGVVELAAHGRIDEFGKNSFIEGSLVITEDYSTNPDVARASLVNGIMSASSAPSASFSSASIPPPGATLTVKKTTSGSDAYVRFSYTRHDPRIGATGVIAAGTYATTMRDGASITSGLSAVGRYALPVPLPAEFVFVLLPPAGTNVHFGAAVPYFGQAGGGVEAFFPKGFSNQTRCYTIPSY